MSKYTAKCPFCGGPIHIQLTDSEGNFKSDSYLEDPYSGIGYALTHTDKDVPSNIKCCPISTDESEHLGVWIYDTEEEAITALNKKESL